MLTCHICNTLMRGISSAAIVGFFISSMLAFDTDAQAQDVDPMRIKRCAPGSRTHL